MASRFVILLFATLIAAPAGATIIGPVNNPANHHDYYLNDNVLTWQAARTWALSLGGDLVTIDNAAENAFVTGILPPFPDAFWLGASDTAVEGAFAWASGAPFAYANWTPGEPDDNVELGGDGDYAVLDRASGMWSDSNGNFSFPGAIAEVVRPLGVPSGADALSITAIPSPGRVDVRFELGRTLDADVAVFDVSGRRVRELARGIEDAGAHAVRWDLAGERPGLYFVSIAAGGERRTAKVAIQP